MVIMETMEYSEPLKSTNGTFFSFKNGTLNAWRSANRIWKSQMHPVVKVAVAVLLSGCLVGAITIVFTGSHNRFIRHNFPCSSSKDCDTGDNLVCKNLQCECLQSSELGPAVFDGSHVDKGWLSTTIGRCVLQPEGRCSLGEENYPCAANSTCKNGLCKCMEGFYFHQETQRCTPVLSFLAKCNSTNSCQKGLMCHQGTCSCDHTKMTFDIDTLSCMGKVGEKCNKNLCVPTASCSHKDECVCPEGLQASLDTESCIPLLKLGEACGEKVACGTDDFSGFALICNNSTNKFSCDPGTSVLDHQSCLPKAGQQCVEEECSPDSFCYIPPIKTTSKRTQLVKPVCKCQEDKEPHAETGLCVSEYKGPCKRDSDCGHSMGCKDLKCHCQFGYQMFDSYANKCLSKMDGKCDKDEDCAGSGKCSIFTHRCYCSFHWIETKETPEGHCSGLINRYCRHDEDCFQEALLKCVENVGPI